MRYKLLACAFVLLIATPALAQKMSPIIVETGKPVPSVVRSGEPFRITYRAQYTEAVLIIEEQMWLNNLTLLADSDGKLKLENSVTGDVEVLNLVIGEKFRDGSEETGFINVQDFTYTFMIISEKKANYKIPSFNFVYVLKKAGTTAAEAKGKEQLREFPTKEVGISYVSSIVKPPPLNIRDVIEFGAFEALAGRLLMLAYGLIGSASLLALIILVRFSRQPGIQEAAETDAAETSEAGVVVEVVPVPSPQRARKEILREFRKLLKDPGVRNRLPDLEKKVYDLLRQFILAALAKEPIKALESDTPSKLHSRLLKLEDKQKAATGLRRYAIFLSLSEKMRDYYQDIESGDSAHFSNPEGEIRTLVGHIESLSVRTALWKAAKSYLEDKNAR